MIADSASSAPSVTKPAAAVPARFSNARLSFPPPFRSSARTIPSTTSSTAPPPKNLELIRPTLPSIPVATSIAALVSP